MVHTVSQCCQRLRLSLDALRRYAQIKAPAEADDCAHENVRFGADAKFLYEASIHLEFVKPQFIQMIEARISGAKIIDCNTDS